MKKQKIVKKNKSVAIPWKFREDVIVTYDDVIDPEGMNIPVSVHKKPLRKLTESWTNSKTKKEETINWISCFGIKNMKSKKFISGKVPSYELELDRAVLTKYASNKKVEGHLVYESPTGIVVFEDVNKTETSVFVKLDEGDPPIGISN